MTKPINTFEFSNGTLQLCNFEFDLLKEFAICTVLGLLHIKFYQELIGMF